MSKNSFVLSSKTAGANGRKPSLFLTIAFIRSLISGFRGSAIIDLAPKDLGPNSILPENQPTTAPSERRLAVYLSNWSVFPLKFLYLMDVDFRRVSTDFEEYWGPRYTCSSFLTGNCPHVSLYAS